VRRAAAASCFFALHTLLFQLAWGGPGESKEAAKWRAESWTANVGGHARYAGVVAELTRRLAGKPVVVFGAPSFTHSGARCAARCAAHLAGFSNGAIPAFALAARLPARALVYCSGARCLRSFAFRARAVLPVRVRVLSSHTSAGVPSYDQVAAGIGRAVPQLGLFTSREKYWGGVSGARDTFARLPRLQSTLCCW